MNECALGPVEILGCVIEMLAAAALCLLAHAADEAFGDLRMTAFPKNNK